MCNLATALDVEITFLCAYLLSNLCCTGLFENSQCICFLFVVHLNLSVAHLHVQIDKVFMFVTVFVAHFLYIGYCDFHDSMELEYQTALHYLEFEQEQLQITAKKSNMIILQSVFLKKFICLVCLTFFNNLCMHAHIQAFL